MSTLPASHLIAPADHLKPEPAPEALRLVKDKKSSSAFVAMVMPAVSISPCQIQELTGDSWSY